MLWFTSGILQVGVGLITKEQQNNHHDHDLNYHFNSSEQQLTNKHFNLYCDWNHMVQIYIVKQNVIKHVYLKQSMTYYSIPCK